MMIDTIIAYYESIKFGLSVMKYNAIHLYCYCNMLVQNDIRSIEQVIIYMSGQQWSRVNL